MSSKCSHFLQEGSFQSYEPTIKSHCSNLSIKEVIADFRWKHLQKNLHAHHWRPQSARMRSKNLIEGCQHCLGLVDQELAFLKSGYNSQLEQRFKSYGLPNLGRPNFQNKCQKNVFGRLYMYCQGLQALGIKFEFLEPSWAA